MIKKRTKDGFRNPRYDELDRKVGMVVFSLLGIGFVALVVMMFVGATPVA